MGVHIYGVLPLEAGTSSGGPKGRGGEFVLLLQQRQARVQRDERDDGGFEAEVVFSGQPHLQSLGGVGVDLGQDQQPQFHFQSPLSLSRPPVVTPSQI